MVFGTVHTESVLVAFAFEIIVEIRNICQPLFLAERIINEFLHRKFLLSRSCLFVLPLAYLFNHTTADAVVSVTHMLLHDRDAMADAAFSMDEVSLFEAIARRVVMHDT